MRVATSLAVLLWIGAAAHAQPNTASQASTAAAALFDKGRQYASAGKYVEACAAFEHSQRLDPQLGTLFNLATCNTHLGKLATAWGEFRDIAQRDPNKTRRAKAANEAAALARRLPKLIIKLEPAVADASVTSNGADVAALVGVESPVDLGDYAIVARAPGYAESRTTVNVTDEARTVVVTIALARPLPEAPPLPVAPAEPAPVALPIQTVRMVEPVPAAPGRKTLAVATLAGGGVLLAGGVVLGELASSRWSAAKAACGPDLACSDASALVRAQGFTRQARLRGNLSTGLFVAGGVAVAAGVYLWIRAPSPASASAWLVPSVTPSGAGLAVEGRL